MASAGSVRSEEHTSELQSHVNLVCRLLLEKKKKKAFNVRVLQNIRDKFMLALRHRRIRHRLRSLCDRLDHAGILYREQAFRFFFFNDTATTEIYTLSLHDALPI